ncbi:MAG TPA: DUF1501 domain-containing protein [Deltaproteobacteria bacterium]|nr:DUF1501 domain-containing protein [Deltaproteobacteria bacterium]
MNRRHFLTGAGACLAALGVPLGASAVPANDRKFIFVFAPGGWDPTRVFADGLDNPNVDMEPGSQRASVGDLSWIRHNSRPTVDAFFQANAAETLILNGVMVRSIAHEICTMIMMTGTTSGLQPDWPAAIATADRAELTLPHLVIDGPSFPGDQGVSVSRTGVNGQLEALISGQVEDWSQIPVDHPDRVAENLIDRYLARRAGARAGTPRSILEGRLTADFRDSVDKLTDLKDLRYTMDFNASTLLEDQARVAVDALSLGVSRCVTLASGAGGWDTHADNDNLQAPLWESLFQGLTQLMVLLKSTPGAGGGTLADETTVVVLSEMGRTPLLNDLNGKDHWPNTSVMIVGKDVTGGRVVGGFDESFYGRGVDPATGEIDDGAQALSAEAVGATLLALADVDPDPYVSGVVPITGVLT